MLHSALQSSCAGLGSQGPASMQLFVLGKDSLFNFFSAGTRMHPHQFIVVTGARTLPGGLYREPSGRAAGPQLPQAQGRHCSRRAAVEGVQEEGYIGTRLEHSGGKGKRPGPINVGRKTEAGPEDAWQVGSPCSRSDPRVLDLSTYLACDPGPFSALACV